MSRSNDEYEDRDDSATTQAAKRLFDASVERLDAATLSQLNRRRQKALAALREDHGPARWRLWLPATGVAAAIAAALLVWHSPDGGRPVPPVDAATDLDILMTDEDLEMLEELEFYAWLGSEDAEPVTDDHVG